MITGRPMNRLNHVRIAPNFNDDIPYVLEVYSMEELPHFVGVIGLCHWVLTSRKTLPGSTSDTALIEACAKAKELGCFYSVLIGDTLPDIIDDLELRGQLTLREESVDE